VLAIDKYLDDPVGALSAHGLAGIWGTLSVGLFGSERLILDGAAPGVWYALFGDAALSASVGQFAVQAVGVAAIFALVLVISLITFGGIKATVGLRVPEEEEDAGLDISSHGMYGYPEQFIPQPEYPGAASGPLPAGQPAISSSTLAAPSDSASKA
jgi:Amt family ammonium transporter